MSIFVILFTASVILNTIPINKGYKNTAMHNKDYNLQFSERLRELMAQRGYASRSASSGVSPSALTKAIGCYTEMALRYIDGRSIPNPEIILKISEWLEVEPGYLLFGDQGYKSPIQDNNLIKIDKVLLEYALKKISPIIKHSSNDEVLEFFVSILSDLSQMNIEPEQLKKVFDLTIKSSVFFERDAITDINDYGKSKSPRKVAS